MKSEPLFKVPPKNAKEAIAILEERWKKMKPFTPEQIEEIKKEAAEMAARNAPTPLYDFFFKNPCYLKKHK